jgi:hypothetical protein
VGDDKKQILAPQLFRIIPTGQKEGLSLFKKHSFSHSFSLLPQRNRRIKEE